MKQIKEGKMVGYKLSKNDLVAPFFVIFRSVREKLLVTVFFDHPVSSTWDGKTFLDEKIYHSESQRNFFHLGAPSHLTKFQNRPIMGF